MGGVQSLAKVFPRWRQWLGRTTFLTLSLREDHMNASAGNALLSNFGLKSEVLVDPEWLAAPPLDPGVRVVEVDGSPTAHDDWHIDGAVLRNVYSDLKDSVYRLVERPSF